MQLSQWGWRVTAGLSTVLTAVGLVSTSASADERPPSGVPSVGTPFEFPVQPGTPQWQDFTNHRQMLQATAIPEPMLKQLTTPALAQTVLDYPLFMDIKAYNSDQRGMDAVAKQFNGLRELLQRPDAGSALLPMYQAFQPTTVGLTAADRGEHLFDGWRLEVLLAQPSVLHTLNTAQLDTILATADQTFAGKQADRAHYGEDGLESTSLLLGRALAVRDGWAWQASTFLREGNGSDGIPQQIRGAIHQHLAAPANLAAPGSSQVLQAAIKAVDTPSVRTPHGTLVAVEQRATDLTSDELRYLNDKVTQMYPLADRETQASRRYNCHSYAWFSQSPTNDKWMMSPGDDAYWKDGSYRRWSRTMPYGPGMRWSWVQGDHSAVEIGKTGRVRSKWGNYPVMTHEWDYSPYPDVVVNRYLPN